MLCLSRRDSESITITTREGTITLHFGLKDKRSRIQVSIDAPRSFKVLRSELNKDNEHVGQAVETV